MRRGLILILSVLLLAIHQPAIAIVNGVDVGPENPIARSTVSLSGPFYKSFGSGVLIDRKHVLTVHHNWTLWPRTIEVRFGSPLGSGGSRVATPLATFPNVDI